eukprot:2509082-Pleurochrysis_carterae.AAC.2
MAATGKQERCVHTRRGCECLRGRACIRALISYSPTTPMQECTKGAYGHTHSLSNVPATRVRSHAVWTCVRTRA